MTPAREAIVLPVLLLTVTWLGGLRVSERVLLEPPTLISLVMAVLLLVVLIQSGAIAPSRLVDQSRTSLANANGAVVLLATFVASAQVLSCVTPTSGLPALMVSVLVSAMLVQMLSASLDRTRVLRAMAVTLGVAFVLKFVLLASLSAPVGGPVARALQLLFDNVTMGAITQAPLRPVNGYLAFATIALYLLTLPMLPGARWRTMRVEGVLLPLETERERLAE